MKAMKKALPAILAIVLASSSILSYAATFNDMKNSKGQDHWSLPYVTDISSKGLVGGYSDGSFKPNKAVTRIESVVFISRLFPVETVKSVYEANKAKWDAKLTANAIPDFAKSAVVFGLERNWYTEAYLKEFMNTSTKVQRDAQRYEFAVYLVRAIGWDKEMSNAAVVSYKDTKDIPKQAVPYIEILGKKGVVVTSGEFKPLKSVTRGEVAKMLSVAYPFSIKATGTSGNTTGNQNSQNQSNQNTAPVNNGTVVMPSGTIVEGKLKQVTVDNYNVIVIITDNSGRLLSYTNRSTGVITSLDGKSVEPATLREGYNVKLYTDGTTLKGIEATSVAAVNKTLSGEVVSVTSSNIRIKNGSITEEFGFANNVTVTRDGKSARVTDIVSGDSITATVQNSMVVTVDAKMVKRTMRNVVVRGITSYSNGSAEIIVQDDKGNQYTMQFTTNSTAYMNNKKVGTSSIAIGYEVDIYANSNEILDITLYGQTTGSVLTGVVTDLNAREDILYIKKSDGKEVKVVIAPRAEIVDQLTQKTKSVYDISKGDQVILNGYDGVNYFEASRIAFYR